MAYYGIEREGDSLQHFEWKKPTKYKDKKLVNGKWVYIYDNLKTKANYAVNRVKKSAEEAARKLKGKYYSTKSKAQELEAKVNRRLHGIKDADVISTKIGNKEVGPWGDRRDDGKARSTTRTYGNDVQASTGKLRLYNKGTTQGTKKRIYKSEMTDYNRSMHRALQKSLSRDQERKNETTLEKARNSTNNLPGGPQTIGHKKEEKKKTRPKSSTHKRRIIN